MSSTEIFENVICISGGKGGVGKSLLALTMAYLLSKHLKKSVCLIIPESILKGLFRVRIPKFSSEDLKELPTVAKISSASTVWSSPQITLMIKDDELLKKENLKYLVMGWQGSEGYDVVIIDGVMLDYAGHNIYLINQCAESVWNAKKVEDRISLIVYNQTEPPQNQNLDYAENADVSLPYTKELNLWFNRGVWMFDNIVPEEIEYVKKVADLINRRGLGYIQELLEDEAPSSQKKKSNNFLSKLLGKIRK